MQPAKILQLISDSLEREKGFEPSTSTLARVVPSVSARYPDDPPVTSLSTTKGATSASPALHVVGLLVTTRSNVALDILDVHEFLPRLDAAL